MKNTGFEKSFVLSIRLAKRKFFTISFGGVRTIATDPYFSTSAELLNFRRNDYEVCGQCQTELLSMHPKAMNFYQKWNKKHLSPLKEHEYDELMKDINELKSLYKNYLDTDAFNHQVKFDRSFN